MTPLQTNSKFSLKKLFGCLIGGWRDQLPGKTCVISALPHTNHDHVSDHRISEKTGTDSRNSGLKHLSCHTGNPSQPTCLSFHVSGLSTSPMCQREDTIGQDSNHRLKKAKRPRRKNQRRRRPRNPSRNVPRHGAVVEMVPTLKLIEAVAEGTFPNSMHFRQ